jgi:hypothetical protein
MIDFSPVRSKQATVNELAEGLTPDDLRRLTNEMVDKMLALIADCVDADVTFLPDDPEAFDSYAEDPDLVEMAWTLGHVIVHTTASAEESAFLAAEMARGVKPHGRSRHEVPWKTVTTIGQCRQRLEESRRMRLASLEMWPDQPHLNVRYLPYPAAGEVNPVGRFVLGLSHDDAHVGQTAKIVRQAKAARV